SRSCAGTPRAPCRAMRNIIVIASLLSLATIARADDNPPRCTIVKIEGTDTDITVHGVFANGARWVEYNCRTYSHKPASEWLSAHGGCGAKHSAFHYTLALGKKGEEKMIDMTIMCPK